MKTNVNILIHTINTPYYYQYRSYLALHFLWRERNSRHFYHSLPHTRWPALNKKFDWKISTYDNTIFWFYSERYHRFNYIPATPATSQPSTKDSQSQVAWNKRSHWLARDIRNPNAHALIEEPTSVLTKEKIEWISLLDEKHGQLYIITTAFTINDHFVTRFWFCFLSSFQPPHRHLHSIQLSVTWTSKAEII